MVTKPRTSVAYTANTPSWLTSRLGGGEPAAEVRFQVPSHPGPTQRKEAAPFRTGCSRDAREEARLHPRSRANPPCGLGAFHAHRSPRARLEPGSGVGQGLRLQGALPVRPAVTRVTRALLAWTE